MAASVDVDATVEQAWAAVTDWPAQAAWMPMTRVDVVGDAGNGLGGRVPALGGLGRVDVVGDAANGLGARPRAVSGLGRIAVVDEMEIDRWEPPHRCDVRHDGRVVRGRGVFLVEPIGADRARVTWEEHLDGFAARAGAPVGRRILRLALQRFTKTLAR